MTAMHKTKFLERHWNRIAVMGILFLCSSACSDVIQPESTFVPANEAFWRLTMNHRAVNLSLAHPYDTLTLIATPRNIDGDPLPDSSVATFRSDMSTDSAVIVYPDGRIEARAETTTDEGIRVIATMTLGGMTHEDTTMVTVTDVVTPPRLAGFQFVLPPGDSSRIAAQGYLNIQVKQMSTMLVVQDSTHTSIPRLTVFYESSDPTIATIDRQTGLLTAQLRGVVTIRATAMAYGIAATDSIQITVTDPVVMAIVLGSDTWDGESDVITERRYTFSGRTTYLTPGGNVVWINQTTDSVDIVFDNPAPALKGTGLLGILYGDTGGNMMTFGLSRADIFENRTINAYRVRSFLVPGSYTWHSTRRAVSGTVIVR